VSDDRSVADEGWAEYYDEYEDREPREMLVRVLGAFGAGEHQAVDLGCGSGIDTLAMLRAGWRVFATDAEPEGIRRLRARVPEELSPRLRVELGRMEDVELPPTDLIWAGFSLFFCRPDRFGDVWGRILAAIRPGGRFAGQLLGDRDAWARDPGISSFSRERALAFFDELEIEEVEEEEEDGDAGGEPKHWHVFHVVARRPA
jgi:tellurite methyltransferase